MRTFSLEDAHAVAATVVELGDHVVAVRAELTE